MDRNAAIKHRTQLAEAGEAAIGCRTAKLKRAEQAEVGRELERRGDEVRQ